MNKVIMRNTRNATVAYILITNEQEYFLEWLADKGFLDPDVLFTDEIIIDWEKIE